MSDQNSQPETGFFSCILPSNIRGLFSSSRPSQGHDESVEQKTADATAPTQSSAQTPYVPQHAKDSFLKTATPRQMKKANEIL